MFENISQGLFTTGAAGYMVIAPTLRLIATVLMAISLYRLLKSRQDRRIVLWMIATFIAPIVTRIAFEIYSRWIAKKETEKVRTSLPLLIAALILYAVAAAFTVASVFSMGAGLIKSEIDGELISTYYDRQGNEYGDCYDIVLYDKSGNKYTYESEWFTFKYVDQNGKSYDGDYCYLSEDGYFYYDEGNELKPYEDTYDYYTDGETVYYWLMNRVYWTEDGTVYERSGRMHLELFDFEN